MSEDYGMGVVVEEPFGIDATKDYSGFGFDRPDSSDVATMAADGDCSESQDETEDLWAIDHDADEKTIKDSLPPQGDYEVALQAGPLAIKEVEGIRIPDQRYFGIGVREVDGVPYKARIRFSLCPRKLIKTNGRTHWAYLMYISAGKAFLSANGRKHETYAELSEWLVQNTVRVYVTHTKDNDYMSKEIKPTYSDIPF